MWVKQVNFIHKKKRESLNRIIKNMIWFKHCKMRESKEHEDWYKSQEQWIVSGNFQMKFDSFQTCKGKSLNRIMKHRWKLIRFKEHEYISTKPKSDTDGSNELIQKLQGKLWIVSNIIKRSREPETGNDTIQKCLVTLCIESNTQKHNLRIQRNS